MSLDDKVHAALKTLIDTGLVREVHTQRHAQYVEGGPVPDEVNVSAVLDAAEPDEHRTEIERLLQTAGFGQVVLRLQGETTLRSPAEEVSEQKRGDVAIEDDRSTRERAHRLWDAEGRPEGRKDEYWHRAEELIHDEFAIVVPAQPIKREPHLTSQPTSLLVLRIVHSAYAHV